jgi:hypothetical protein
MLLIQKKWLSAKAQNYFLSVLKSQKIGDQLVGGASRQRTNTSWRKNNLKQIMSRQDKGISF